MNEITYLSVRRTISILLAILWPAVLYISNLVNRGYWPLVIGWFTCILVYTFWVVQELEVLKLNRLPSLFYVWFTLIAWGGLWLVIPVSYAVWYLIASLFSMYFLLRTVGKFGDTVMVWRQVLVSFPTGVLLLALSQLVPFSQPVYLLIAFLMSLGLLRGTLTYLPFESSKVLIGSLVLGVVMTELLWIFSLISIDFAWLGFIWFMIFHTIWTMYYHYMYQTLTRQRAIFQIIICALSSGIALTLVLVI